MTARHFQGSSHAMSGTDPSAESRMSGSGSERLDDRRPLRAASLAEAYLFVTVQHCDVCEQGPLKVKGTLREQVGGEACTTLTTRCGQCGRVREYLFHVAAEELPAVPGTGERRINPTGRPSQLIDVAGWVTLYQMILSAAERASSRGERRELQVEAAECLSEALRFYDDENEMPPKSAFFSPRARRRLRDHPEQYIRSSLVAKLARLPRPGEQRARPAARKWWQFWR